MKRIINARRIMSEYNKYAKNKISFYGAKVLQEEAKRKAEETGNDACIEILACETKDGTVHLIR